MQRQRIDVRIPLRVYVRFSDTGIMPQAFLWNGRNMEIKSFSVVGESYPKVHCSAPIAYDVVCDTGKTRIYFEQKLRAWFKIEHAWN